MALKSTSLRAQLFLMLRGAIELNIRRDPTIYDGQFSNNGWLQELPKPMTKLTWDNAVLSVPRWRSGCRSK